jgi:glycosyltransferase involved in cell wall biosynthesis
LRVLMITQKVERDDDVLGYVHGWIERLAVRLERLHVLGLGVGSYALPDNVTVYSMGKEKGAGRLARLVRLAQVAGGLSRRRQIDLIFAHQCPRYALLAAPFGKFFGLPLVMFYAHKSVDLELRLAHRLVERVTTSVPTGFMLPSDKVTPVGQGIELSLFQPDFAGEEKATIVAVGRLSPIKDYETLIRSADTLLREYRVERLKLLIVGGATGERDGQYFGHLKQTVGQLQLDGRVEFVGPVPHEEVPHYLRRATVTVNLCPTGAVDKAALEGMACGKPTVVCNRGFVPVLGAHAPHLLFDEGDPASLAERLAALLRMPVEQRRSMGMGLRDAVVAQHGVEGLADNLVRVFREVVGHERG